MNKNDSLEIDDFITENYPLAVNSLNGFFCNQVQNEDIIKNWLGVRFGDPNDDYFDFFKTQLGINDNTEELFDRATLILTCIYYAMVCIVLCHDCIIPIINTQKNYLCDVPTFRLPLNKSVLERVPSQNANWFYKDLKYIESKHIEYSSDAIDYSFRKIKHIRTNDVKKLTDAIEKDDEIGFVSVLEYSECDYEEASVEARCSALSVFMSGDYESNLKLFEKEVMKINSLINPNIHHDVLEINVWKETKETLLKAIENLKTTLGSYKYRIHAFKSDPIFKVPAAKINFSAEKYLKYITAADVDDLSAPIIFGMYEKYILFLEAQTNDSLSFTEQKQKLSTALKSTNL